MKDKGEERKKKVGTRICRNFRQIKNHQRHIRPNFWKITQAHSHTFTEKREEKGTQQTEKSY